MEKLSIPVIFNKLSSSFSWRLIKNNWDDIKKINGKTSNKIEGVFKNVRKRGNWIPTAYFSKKTISSKIFNKKLKTKNIKLTTKKYDKKDFNT